MFIHQSRLNKNDNTEDKMDFRNIVAIFVKED
jgi:hypothetical protein